MKIYFYFVSSWLGVCNKGIYKKKILQKNNLHILSGSKHANFSLKLDFWRGKHIF